MSFSLAGNFLKREERNNFPGGDASLKEELLGYTRTWYFIIWGFLILCVVATLVFGSALILYSVPGVDRFFPEALTNSVNDITRDSDLAAPFDTLFFGAFVLFEAGLFFWASRVIAKAFGAWRLLILDRDALEDLDRKIDRLEDEKKSLERDREHLMRDFLQARENAIKRCDSVSDALFDQGFENENLGNPRQIINIYRSDFDVLDDAIIQANSKKKDAEYESEDLRSDFGLLQEKYDEATRRINYLEACLKDAQNSSGKTALTGLNEAGFVSAYQDRLEELSRVQRGEVRAQEMTSEIVEAFSSLFPDKLDGIQKLAYTTAEHKRINQYEAIMELYNEKIAKVRAQDMDEEDRDDAIAHWKRLRDTEVEELTRASDV